MNGTVHASPDLPPVAILAGGRGTRLGELPKKLPKPLVQVAGEPFLFHPLRKLSAAGVTSIVLCVGYRGNEIEKVIGTRWFGMDVAYSYDAPGLEGTLGALRRARPLLGDRFLVQYGDTLLSLDYAALIKAWDASKLPGMLAVLKNRGQWGTSNTSVSKGFVTCHHKGTPSRDMMWIDYGVAGLRGSCLDLLDRRDSDLSSLYSWLAQHQLLGAFPVTRRFYEIGTPQSLRETERFLARRLISADTHLTRRNG